MTDQRSPFLHYNVNILEKERQKTRQTGVPPFFHPFSGTAGKLDSFVFFEQQQDFFKSQMMANYQESHLKLRFHFFLWPSPSVHHSFDDGKSKILLFLLVCLFFCLSVSCGWWPIHHSSNSSPFNDFSWLMISLRRPDTFYTRINKQSSRPHLSIPFMFPLIHKSRVPYLSEVVNHSEVQVSHKNLPA